MFQWGSRGFRGFFGISGFFRGVLGDLRGSQWSSEEVFHDLRKISKLFQYVLMALQLLETLNSRNIC